MAQYPGRQNRSAVRLYVQTSLGTRFLTYAARDTCIKQLQDAVSKDHQHIYPEYGHVLCTAVEMTMSVCGQMLHHIAIPPNYDVSDLLEDDKHAFGLNVLLSMPQAAQQPQRPSALAPKPAAVLTTRAPLLTCEAAGLLQTLKPGPVLCDKPALVKPKLAVAQQQQAHKVVQQLTVDRQQAVQGHAHAKSQGQAITASQESHPDAASQQARFRQKRKTKADQALQSQAFPLESQKQLLQQQQQQQQQLSKQEHACVASAATQTDAGVATDTAELEGDPARADDTRKTQVHRQAAQGSNPVVASAYLSTQRAVSLCPTAPLVALPTRAVAVQHQTPALEACKEQDAELACGNQEKPESGSPLAGRFLHKGLHVKTPSAHRPSQDKAADAHFMAVEDSVPICQPVVLTDFTNTSQKHSKRKHKHALLGAATGTSSGEDKTDHDPAAISAWQAGQVAGHHPHSTAAADDVHGSAGAVPSNQTSLAPGPHAQLPPVQAAPAMHNTMAQAADRPADQDTHPASPAAPDAAQLSANLRPGNKEQPDTSREPVSLCPTENNAIAAAATDGQQAPASVSAQRQLSKKRLAETASKCTAFPAPHRSHGAGKQKRHKPAPSFHPDAKAGDVSADVLAVQQSRLTPTAPAQPSAEPSRQPQLLSQLQQKVGHQPIGQADAVLPVSHMASAQKQSQPDPEPELQPVPQASYDAQVQAESQLEPDSLERVSTQLLAPDAAHVSLQSQLHSVPEAANLTLPPSTTSHSQRQSQLWCCTWSQPVQQTPPQPDPPAQCEHEPRRMARHEPWVRPQPQPAAARFDCQGLMLLPTEAQLHCERLVASQVQGSPSATVANYPAFGSVEGAHLAAEWRDACDARLSSYEQALQASTNQFDQFEVRIRKRLWMRAFLRWGRAAADEALAAHDTFVQVVLMGQYPDGPPGPPDSLLSAQACQHYHAMLAKVYGPELVLEPYVMSVDALSDQESEELRNFRLLQRRFIVYNPSKAAHIDSAAEGLLALASERRYSTGEGQLQAPNGLSPAGPASHATTQSSHPDWDATLAGLWEVLQKKTCDLTVGQLQEQADDATAASCIVQNGGWQQGLRSSEVLPDDVKIWDTIAASMQQAPGSLQRLYFTDGTFPGELPPGCNSHADIPGLCCGVDQAVNGMLPAVMRSNRAGSLFKQMCVESTGTASFTFFAPCGQAPNLTAFHQETKKRRSWNCGCGDFIVQPLSTAASVRQVERVHAAVVGAHERHACLLPLEMYLEEDIPLVCYMRDHGHAQMVELPEQSCHAFMSFANAQSPQPSLKVSCNDWHINSEMSSAYLLEKLLASCRHAGVEASLGRDDAEGDDPDGWVESTYAMLQPCHIPHNAKHMEHPRLNGSWQRPWADEMKDQKSSPKDIAKQAQKSKRSSHVSVLVVRLAEKVVDAIKFQLKATGWNALLKAPEGPRVLQDVLPVLLDLSLRAMAGSTKQGRDFPFSQRYMQHVVGDVQHTLYLTGMNTAAKLTQTLLGSSVFCSQHADEETADSRELHLQGDAAISQKLLDIAHSDQVFIVYMLLKHAAEYEVLPGRRDKTAADKTQLTSAAQDAAALLDCFHSLLRALTEDELMQMGLPALRLAAYLMWPQSYSDSLRCGSLAAGNAAGVASINDAGPHT
ncbi:TPA: hypothetical protein ACH3X1_012371 [Trebouxia sp. C0004]